MGEIVNTIENHWFNKQKERIGQLNLLDLVNEFLDISKFWGIGKIIYRL